MKKLISIIILLAAALFIALIAGCPTVSNDEGTSTPKSSVKAITLFGFTTPAAVGTINESAKTIAVTVPNGTNVTALAATFTTTGASVKVGTVTQVNGVTANDFTNSVTYTVTAADSSTVNYSVTVTPALANAKAITAFGFTTPAAVGTINESAKTIAVTVPYGTNVTSLIATFTTTGASVNIGSTVQTNGTTANDFTDNVIYTVTAADSTTQDYTVTVTPASANAKEITEFGFLALGAVGTINESAKTIAVTVPNGTNVTTLVATFITTGANVKVDAVTQTSGVTANDFSSSKTYTVTAADSSTVDYTVNVAIAHAVIFDSQGGTSVASQTVASGDFATSPTAPTLTGFTFTGWYKEQSPASVWNFATDAVTSDTTLYAKWTSSSTVNAAASTSGLTNTVELVGVPGVTTVLQGRTVNLTSFYIGKYEITYKQWYEVKTWAASNGYIFANQGREGSDGTDGAAPGSTTEPVTAISWRDCIVWCNALSERQGLTPCYTYGGSTVKSAIVQTVSGTYDCDVSVLSLTASGYRLPTEAEWEYAARYKDGTNWTPADYLSGATANYTDNAASFAVGVFRLYNDDTLTGVTKTANVGSKTGGANALGIYDMSGNVVEWTSDLYEPIGTSAETNPTGASSGSERIYRGGSYADSTVSCQVGYRGEYITGIVIVYMTPAVRGLRIVRR